MISVLAAPRPAPPAPRTFTGSLPDPEMAGLYEYSDHFDSPSIGRRRIARPTSIDTFESAAPMARWLTENEHTHPFFHDPDFIAEFGPISKPEAVAAVNALWMRADRAAAAAGTTITLPARLGGSNHHERNHA